MSMSVIIEAVYDGISPKFLPAGYCLKLSKHIYQQIASQWISHQPSAFLFPICSLNHTMCFCADRNNAVSKMSRCIIKTMANGSKTTIKGSLDLWHCLAFFVCFEVLMIHQTKGLTLYFSRRDAVMPKQVAQIGSHTQAFIHTGLCFFTQQVCNRLNRSQLKDPWSRA